MKALFEQYGFNFMPEFSNNQADIFTIKQGVFDNAYVVAKSKNSDLSHSSIELKKLGFSVKELKPQSNDEVHKELFDGFFQSAKAKRKISSEYDSYVTKVVKSYPTNARNYNYISAPYLTNGEVNGDSPVINRITTEILGNGPKLILIEAAAGFGKTSTAFEICNKLSKDISGPIVMLAELSRDRKAKIFRHILLEEIDRSFPSLSSTLVESEITNGNIVVVLDGFDELLRGSKDESDFEKSEAMLETIAKLLRGNSKVILTTRKTAILEGEGFYNWADSHQEHFETLRLSLLEPEIRDWLQSNRITSLEEAGISLPNISNPVLLSYLSFMSDEGFNDAIKNPESIHDRYFNAMLEREQKRQNLHMTPLQQSQLLTRLAADMVARNYTKDHRAEITRYLIENELALLEETRLKYSADEKPDLEELAIKLSNHAFLDRISSDDRIGFINDFVLGSYVGKSILEYQGNEWIGEELFIEVAIEAYASKSKEVTAALWQKLKWVTGAISDQNRISFESRLLKRVDGIYKNSTINDTVFEDSELFKIGKLEDATLCNCTFRGCTIYGENIINCCFVDCHIYQCNITSPKDNLTPSTFHGCVEESGNVISTLKLHNDDDNNNDKEPQNVVWKFIFEKFWPVGKESITFAHRPLSIFYGKTDDDVTPEAVAASIVELKREGYLVNANQKSWIGINITKLGEIAKILEK
ncbi:NACHT domain-containing protein [Janthinobacterium sp. GB1R12]|uniref:NACHT domain-containing protein n=1 Tax=Janthinobacterium sp. GB1R12 TaxID=3424190 RepID=UPI003F2429F2